RAVLLMVSGARWARSREAKRSESSDSPHTRVSPDLKEFQPNVSRPSNLKNASEERHDHEMEWESDQQTTAGDRRCPAERLRFAGSCKSAEGVPRHWRRHA